ncbi:type II and III secretion system protein family protein [Paraburkholderia lycopersici]|uniref:Pilus assembly protein CpaC n=1 Tax=Paraburkholderia lycopersici TaxID=416944 RepID=A0A1G7BF95_9BURK|nr:type II and III secretion system protein family protein [Paraburkholderia lycopersici]SDE25714.1 pilus assembly protein CpaC [Paraburkholderia lycopersici]
MKITAAVLSAGLCAGYFTLAVLPARAAPPSLKGAAQGLLQSVDLAVGEQRTLPTTAVLKRVAVGDPSVADVMIVRDTQQGGVLLIGKAAGTTNVMLWEGRGAAHTITVNVATKAARELLGHDTPSVKVLDGIAIISGTAATMEQHQRAVAVAQESIGKDAKDASILDTSSIATRAIVQVDVRVVEFGRAAIKQIGFNFFRQSSGFSFGSFGPSSLSTGMNNTSANNALSAVTPISTAFNLVFASSMHGLAADLSLLETNNLARVLAEPTLVALSGQNASFLAGGEIPVPVPQALGATSIEYKPYGIGLTLTPTVLSPQRIALRVAPEASQLDFTNAVTVSGVSLPAITTRRTETTIELGDGESFVIGGLIDRETSSNVNKVPLLGDLPVIGTFFKQLNYQQIDKELMIIVTPHLVSPLARGATLPATPGEQAEQHNGPVWGALLGGMASRDPVPGFSQ